MPDKRLFVTVGPTRCGKTHLLKHELLPRLAMMDKRTLYFSPDQFRKMLNSTSTPIVKYDDSWVKLTVPAYTAMLAAIRCAFLTDVEYIVVDCTCLLTGFLPRLVHMASTTGWDLHYIHFDYTDPCQWYIHVEDEYSQDRIPHQRAKIALVCEPLMAISGTVHKLDDARNVSEFIDRIFSTAMVGRSAYAQSCVSHSLQTRQVNSEA